VTDEKAEILAWLDRWDALYVKPSPPSTAFAILRAEVEFHSPSDRRFTRNTAGTVCNACSGRHWPCPFIRRVHAALARA
jgi:hypothetical protein